MYSLFLVSHNMVIYHIYKTSLGSNKTFLTWTKIKLIQSSIEPNSRWHSGCRECCRALWITLEWLLSCWNVAASCWPSKGFPLKGADGITYPQENVTKGQSDTSRFGPTSVIRRQHRNNCKHGPGDDSFFLFLIVFPPQSDILLANYLEKKKESVLTSCFSLIQLKKFYSSPERTTTGSI